MWRPYLAAFLLAAVALGGFAAQRYAERAAEEVARLTPASLEEAQADGGLERAYLLYQSKTPLLSTLYVHSSLEEIDERRFCLRPEASFLFGGRAGRLNRLYFAAACSARP